ncbi:S8 family serine peptidase [Scytonema hofmannii FACHB-248]|uniref:S8 family serine peptidase n=1 Tax=Scytonema hofmannii FACHB-248 TaxID=1842502 RepID=A0ABR8GMW5_9CYAN|nr:MULTISPECIES: S8 family serine peptidase [Nostocales]MBD2604508.1 S8 family serine peptidase [Scytonema hofmannii FACHB-248]
MSNGSSTHPIETTGRYLVLLPEGGASSGIRALTDSTGVRDIDDSALSNIGVAIVTLDPNQLQSLNAAVAGPQPILAVEPEQIMYAIGSIVINGDTANYLQGYKEGVTNLVNSLSNGAVTPGKELTTSAFSDGATTWGLQATKVVSSRYTGSGIKIAVLDTGLDLTHPDFAGRTITSESFIPGETVQDLYGHGTHCIGTSCGLLNPPDPSSPMRYGIAYNAEIFVGKVLSNEGSGADGGILTGIDRAISNGCQIISMSLGAPTRPRDTYSQIYEAVAKRALSRGTLIIAAAGNESSRPGFANPVGRPANCPSILAVAAVDNQLQIASFSNSSINPDGGGIDIAGPGVNVYSTWSTDPMTVRPPNGLGPSRYIAINGTSMATPHVAGIAALYAEATGKTGFELWALLMQNAQRLALPSVDVGIGLVQAPV